MAKAIEPQMRKKVMDLFPHLSTKRIVSLTGIKYAAVRTIAHRNKCKKANWKWKQKDIDWLLAWYNIKPASKLAKELKRTIWATRNKYRELTGKRK